MRASTRRQHANVLRAMNLHWAKTLQHKWVRYKPKPYYSFNHTSVFSLYNSNNNSSEHRLPTLRSLWGDSSYLRRNHTSNWNPNNTRMHAQNQFLKKTRVLADMMANGVKSQSFTTVIVIASIFLFITLSITAAVVVFCRKRNMVFSLQKSEQDTEIDYEMDEFNTDMEYTETDFESETDSRSLKQVQRSMSRSFIESDCESSSPAHIPLVSCQVESEGGSPSRTAASSSRGEYQRMTVTAMMETHQTESEFQTDTCNSEDDIKSNNCKRQLRKHRKKSYISTQTMSSDADSDCENSSMIARPPKVTLTYYDDIQSADGKIGSLPSQAQVSVDTNSPTGGGPDFNSSTLEFLQYDNNQQANDSPSHSARDMSYDNKAFNIHEEATCSQPLLVELPAYTSKKTKHRSRNIRHNRYSRDSSNFNNNSNGQVDSSSRTADCWLLYSDAGGLSLDDNLNQDNFHINNMCCTAPTTPVTNEAECPASAMARSCSTPCQLHLAGGLNNQC